MNHVPNKGKPWRQADIDSLELMWRNRVGPQEIAKRLGRTVGGVMAQLVKLGHLYFSTNRLAYCVHDPLYLSQKAVMRMDKELKAKVEYDL